MPKLSVSYLDSSFSTLAICIPERSTMVNAKTRGERTKSLNESAWGRHPSYSPWVSSCLVQYHLEYWQSYDTSSPADWLMEEFSLFFTLIDKSRIDHVLLRQDDHRYHCSDPMIPKTPLQDSSKHVVKIFKDRYMNVHVKFKVCILNLIYILMISVDMFMLTAIEVWQSLAGGSSS